MSDYIAGLRADLVDAAARHERRGSLARRALPVLPRAWSRPALAAGFALAACVAAIVLAVGTIGPPADTPAEPHRIAVVQLGVEPVDAVVSSGDTLWVAGAKGDIVRVVHHRVADRVNLGDLGGGIAADGDSVWAAAIKAGRNGSFPLSGLVRFNARTGAIERRLARHGHEMGALAAGAGGLWVVPSTSQDGATLERHDPVTGRLVAVLREPFGNDIAAHGERVWALASTGDLAEVDPATNRVVAVLRGVSLPFGLNNGATGMSLAAEGDGVWVAGGTRGDVTFVQAGRIARRIRVGEGPVDGVARTRGSLWATLATGAPNTSYRVIRIDPDTGRPTGTLDLGHHQPTALAPAGRALWILTLDGSATLIR